MKNRPPLSPRAVSVIQEEEEEELQLFSWLE
jgi:hypothetical protein